MYHVLFNPKAGGGEGEAKARMLDGLYGKEQLCYHDITKLKDYDAFFQTLAAEDRIILAGGDGTINRFVNDLGDRRVENDIMYYATGSGNDFLRDLGKENGAEPFSIKAYLQDLPVVTVKGKRYRFLNGIGFGIDGYCCQEGDAQRERSDRPINYTAIAIKGLLFHYKPINAKVTVDGKTHSFPKVWLAPTMNGRYYGGGMKVTPEQDRLDPEKKVSVCVMFGSGKLKTLVVFPSIFKGTHIAHGEMAQILTGHEVTVEFERPCALQIDGETILDVKRYTVCAGVPAKTAR